MQVKLYDFTEKEVNSRVLSDFIPWHIRPLVKSVKAVMTDPVLYRQEFQWQAIAIEFVDDMDEAKLIQTTVKLRADEYWGKVDTYHIFWWD
jgi:hypothetical protein